MASVATRHKVEEVDTVKDDKIRISKIGGRFLVFDVEDVARLRRSHNLCAVLVGITPQAPNQTVFSSLPLELTADEVRWLVYERRAAYVADDWQAHLASLSDPKKRKAYMDSVLRQRQVAQTLADEVAAERERRGAEVRATQAAKRAGKKAKKAATKAAEKAKKDEEGEVKEKAETVPEEKAAPVTEGPPNPDLPLKIVVATATDRANDHADLEPLLQPPPRTEEVMQQEDDFIFGGLVEVERMKAERIRGTSPVPGKRELDPTPEKKEVAKKEAPKPTVRITPMTSGGLVGNDEVEDEEGGVALIPPRSTSPSSASSFSSAALRAHLADRGFFTTPGLRFGGALSVYPGDPFRYHAHFVATSYGWNEPIKLLDVVGSGRLATGVKKGLLIGGAKPAEESDGDAVVRTFTLEWAAI